MLLDPAALLEQYQLVTRPGCIQCAATEEQGAQTRKREDRQECMYTGEGAYVACVSWLRVEVAQEVFGRGEGVGGVLDGRHASLAHLTDLRLAELDLDPGLLANKTQRHTPSAVSFVPPSRPLALSPSSQCLIGP